MREAKAWWQHLMPACNSPYEQFGFNINIVHNDNMMNDYGKVAPKLKTGKITL